MKNTVSKTTESINETARSVWLAGLGALHRAQDEGNKLFDALVKEGEKFETDTRADVNKRVKTVRGDIENRFTEVRNRATGNVKKLEKVFEDRVAKVLARLGVPTADDVQKLTRRVEALNKEVKALNSSKTTTKKAA